MRPSVLPSGSPWSVARRAATGRTVVPASAPPRRRALTRSISFVRGMDECREVGVQSIPRANDPSRPSTTTTRARRPGGRRRRPPPSSSSSFEGTRRAREGRTELDDFLDVGMRFEGGKTLIKALTGGSACSELQGLGAVRVGQLAVVSLDKPSLELWESQAALRGATRVLPAPWGRARVEGARRSRAGRRPAPRARATPRMTSGCSSRSFLPGVRTPLPCACARRKVGLKTVGLRSAIRRSKSPFRSPLLGERLRSLHHHVVAR